MQTSAPQKTEILYSKIILFEYLFDHPFAREVKSILSSLAKYAEEKKLIGMKLNEAMDESDRQALLSQLEKVSSIEIGLRQQLTKARRKVGSEEMEIYAQ